MYNKELFMALDKDSKGVLDEYTDDERTQIIKEKFWLLDNYSNKIVSYSKNLEFKESIGVRGESPSEHQSIKNADFIDLF